MKVSIVMTTYNGSRYLREQLDSIKKQNYGDMEILIFDDGSNDGTQKLIQDYIKEYSLENWIFYQNSKNLGWKKNFIEGMKKAQGKYVFPCDQDDIWYDDKVSMMVCKMEENANISLLASNYTVKTEEDDCSGFSKNLDDTGTIEKIELNFHNIYNERPGCVYCIRKSFYDEYVELWKKELGHDDFLWKIALISNSLYIYHKCTIQYRRYGSNTTMRNHSRSIRIKDNQACYELFSEYRKQNKNLTSSQMEFLDKEILFCTLRNQLLNEGKIMKLIKIATLKKMYKTKRHFWGDIACVMAPFMFDD